MAKWRCLTCGADWHDSFEYGSKVCLECKSELIVLAFESKEEQRKRGAKVAKLNHGVYVC